MEMTVRELLAFGAIVEATNDDKWAKVNKYTLAGALKVCDDQTDEITQLTTDLRLQQADYQKLKATLSTAAAVAVQLARTEQQRDDLLAELGVLTDERDKAIYDLGAANPPAEPTPVLHAHSGGQGPGDMGYGSAGGVE